jgi:SAM-dependent methyltransferase
MLPSLTIFFPFFNDAGTVDALITQAYFYGRQISDNLEVIAIHGGASKDHTFDEILKAKSKYPDLVVLDHTDNRDGYGVIRHGFQAATKEWVFYTDGDAQYQLDDLQKLVKNAKETGADAINGFKVRRSDQWLRVFLGRGYQFFCRFFFQLPIRDIDCDFRLIRRSVLKDIPFKGGGASILPELILNLQRRGAKFSEVPVGHYPRIYGQSNYSAIKLLMEKVIGDFKLYCHWKKEMVVSPEEGIFQKMYREEKTLWWFVALREMVFHEVEKLENPSICDVGCGTGNLMEFLAGHHFQVQGVDLSAVSLKYCRERGLKNVCLGSIVDLPFTDDSFDLVIVLDVLTMLEKEDLSKAVKSVHRILKPGGQLILNEPAYQWMRSQHDVACHSKRRFTKKQCVELLTAHGFEVSRASYRVCFLFPLIALVRLIKKFTYLFKLYPESDIKTPSKRLNSFFLAIQRFDNRLLKLGVRLPFGSSVFLVAKK